MPNLDLISKTCSAKLQGDAAVEISAIAVSPELATNTELAFVFPDKGAKALKMIKTTKAAALVLSIKLQTDEPIRKFIRDNSTINFLFVDRPRYALSQIISLFATPLSKPDRGIHSSAYVDPSANVDPSAAIGAFVYIGPRSKIAADVVLMPRVTIGADVSIGVASELHPGVVIEDSCILGARVIVQANSVIGSDGFSYTTSEPSNLEKLRAGNFSFTIERQIQHKILSAGNVIIEDDVEIGSCTAIDRGTLGPTVIGAGTKIDNLCQIAHNVNIGKDVLVIANSGIAGSAKIGDRVTIAGAAGVGDGVEMGNDSVLGAFSAANSNVDAFMPMLGVPALPYGEYMNRQRAYIRLPKIKDEVTELRRELEELKKSLKEKNEH